MTLILRLPKVVFRYHNAVINNILMKMTRALADLLNINRSVEFDIDVAVLQEGKP